MLTLLANLIPQGDRCLILIISFFKIKKKKVVEIF